jgi:hypothetical protein
VYVPFCWDTMTGGREGVSLQVGLQIDATVGHCRFFLGGQSAWIPHARCYHSSVLLVSRPNHLASYHAHTACRCSVGGTRGVPSWLPCNNVPSAEGAC